MQTVRPLYLSGHVGDAGRVADGWMLTPMMGNTPDLSVGRWAADTGCFSRPERFDGNAYLRWLDARPRNTCLFATAPDRVGDAAQTLCVAAPYFDRIRRLGYRVALVGQDGLERLNIPWEEFDAYFVGGSTEWKLSAASERLAQQARAFGHWVHVGRVNSRRRYDALRTWGCVDSVDGTFLAFGPNKNKVRLASWLARANQQPILKPA